MGKKGGKRSKDGGINCEEEISDFSRARAETLRRDMSDAQAADRKANEEGKPAMKKLCMLDEVTRELRRLPI